MNKVRALAQGDWLVFLGCDDVMLDALGPFAAGHRDPGTVYYGNVILRSNGRRYDGPFSRYRMMLRNICHQAIFYPRQVYRTTAYELRFRFLADYEYNLRLMGMGRRFAFIDLAVALYNDQGASARGDPAFARERFRLIRDNFGYLWVSVLVVHTAVVVGWRLLTGRPARLRP